MFDKATRAKLRFTTQSGLIGVEQLWDLSLNKLNDIAKDLNRQIKQAGEVEDFISETSAVDGRLQLSFDVVKHIIAVKLAERDETLNAASKREHNQAILELIKKKQQEDLAGKSVEELQALLK